MSFKDHLVSGLATFRDIWSCRMRKVCACFPGFFQNKVSQSRLLRGMEGDSIAVLEVMRLGHGCQLCHMTSVTHRERLSLPVPASAALVGLWQALSLQSAQDIVGSVPHTVFALCPAVPGSKFLLFYKDTTHVGWGPTQ